MTVEELDAEMLRIHGEPDLLGANLVGACRWFLPELELLDERTLHAALQRWRQSAEGASFLLVQAIVRFGSPGLRAKVGRALARDLVLVEEGDEEDSLLADAWPTLPPAMRHWVLTRDGVANRVKAPHVEVPEVELPDPLPPLHRVEGVQARLNLWQIPTPITGVMDHATRIGIERLQFELWEEPTGVLDERLRIALDGLE